ncbi:MAG TPA: HypC/HybG/HupF family hydrogenase formation chaperone [Tepidisphaeraceae bacterium]|nr:HypC/HybG/HupF family hydrogenase formation chaperone [Tepidisphaeraceae bacterium]
MCLAIPARLVSCRGNHATADLHGNRVEISTVLVPQTKVGDWVLLHAGFAIQKLDEREAAETWAVVKDLRDLGGGS